MERFKTMLIFRLTTLAACLLSITLFAAGCADSPDGEAKTDTPAQGTDAAGSNAATAEADSSGTPEGNDAETADAAETDGAGKAAASGTDDVRTKLIGTWRQADGNPNATMTLTADGVATFRIAEPGVEESIERKSKWTVLDDGRFRLEMSIGDQTQMYDSEIEFEGNDLMVVTEPNGQVKRHERVKPEAAPEGGTDPAE